MQRAAPPASSNWYRSVFGPWEAIALSLALAAAYHVGTLEPGSPWLLNLDDGYIHARLGQNLAASGVLGVNEGSGGGGTSSLLWTLSIAALATLGVPGELAAALLALASLVLVVGIASRLAFDLLPRSYAWIASCVIALSGQTVALSLSGMETLLFSALVIGGLRDAARGRALGATAFLCVGALVRVEAVLAAVAAALLCRAKPRARVFQAVASIGAAAVGIGTLTILGGGLPTTLASRRWLYGMGESLVPGPDWWMALWRRSSSIVSPGGWVGHVWALLAVGLAVLGALRLWQSRRAASVGLYAVLQLLFVAFVVGDDGQLGRYLAPLWILAPVLAAAGFESLSRRWGGKATIALLVVLLALYVPQAWRWADWHRASVEHLRDVHLAMARRIRTVVPPGDAVAAFDIGLLSYFGGHRIVDMGGLADPEIAEAMWDRRVPEVLEEREVRYAVFPEGRRYAGGRVFASRLGFDPSWLGTPIERTSVRSSDLSYLRTTKVAMPALALYELPR